MIPEWMIILSGGFFIWAGICWFIAIENLGAGIKLLVWPAIIISIILLVGYNSSSQPDYPEMSFNAMGYDLLYIWGFRDFYIVLLPIALCVSTTKFVSGWKLSETIDISEIPMGALIFYLIIAAILVGASIGATKSYFGALVFIAIFSFQYILAFAELSSYFNLHILTFFILSIIGDIIFVGINAYIIPVTSMLVMFLGHMMGSYYYHR